MIPFEIDLLVGCFGTFVVSVYQKGVTDGNAAERLRRQNDKLAD